MSPEPRLTVSLPRRQLELVLDGLQLLRRARDRAAEEERARWRRSVRDENPANRDAAAARGAEYASDASEASSLAGALRLGGEDAGVLEQPATPTRATGTRRTR